MITYLAHIFGSGFHFLADSEEAPINWITNKNLKNATFFTHYINSVYYAFITMITVGYGDITPITNAEKIYVIFFTLISCGVFAYSVNTIGSIFREVALKSAINK